ncbi:MAG: DUF533 domain-containing protein [Pseudomonadota bacterium]
MNTTPLIHDLARSGLSNSLAQQAAAWQGTRPVRGTPKDAQRDWVRHISDIAWQACVRYRHGQRRLAVLRAERRPDLSLDRNAFVPGDAFARDFLETVLLRAVVAAAVNGGQLDDAGRKGVLQRLCDNELSAGSPAGSGREDRAGLMGEVQDPVSIKRLALQGQDLPAAATIYAASALAIHGGGASATLYLTALADALRIDSALAIHIQRCVERSLASRPGSRFD